MFPKKIVAILFIVFILSKWVWSTDHVIHVSHLIILAPNCINYANYEDRPTFDCISLCTRFDCNQHMNFARMFA